MIIPEEKYKYILENMPICCIDLVIINEKRVLLIKRKNNPEKGEWFVPGGRILKNETFEQAAKRKAKEETGLDIEIIKALDFDETIYQESNFKNVKNGVHTINVSFLVKSKDDKVKLDFQSEDFKWISQIEEDLNPYVKKMIIKSKVFN